MKTYVLISVYLLLPFIHFSQNHIWPTNEAEWYYSYGDLYTSGYAHYKIERDTIIDSRNYQIYSQQLEWVINGIPSPTIQSSYINKYYIIASEDSVVFYYDEPSGEIDTLINFKAEIGETWRNPLRKGDCIDPSEIMTTEVINKQIETVNGEDLMKFTLLRHVPSIGGADSWDYWEDFYQRMGANFNFVPNAVCGAYDQSMEGFLRCFNTDIGLTSEFTYNNYSGDCNAVEVVGLNESNDSPFIVFQQNDQLIIQGDKLNQIESVQLFSSLGKRIEFTEVSTSSKQLRLQLKNKPSNVFFVKITDKHHTSCFTLYHLN